MANSGALRFAFAACETYWPPERLVPKLDPFAPKVLWQYLALITLENHEHIYYRDHPHFTVGHVDQWGECGYLLYDDKVYSYEEDRKCQYGRTYSPMTIAEFLRYAEKNQIEVPTHFMELLLIRPDHQ